MTFDRQFVCAVHLLALVGVAALAATNDVGAVYLALAVAAIGASAWREWRGSGAQLSPAVSNVAIVLALFVILVPMALRGSSPVRAIGEFLLVLAALKAGAAKELRDWLQICALSFFHLLAASALTVEPVFALVFLAYLVLAPCVLVMLLLRREIESAGGARRLAEESFVEPSLLRSLASTTIVLFVSTLLVFIVFPRMGAGYFGSPFSTGVAHSGFAEEVGPGGVAALQADSAVALRVVVDRPELLPEPLYWRGVALDQFDGRSWRRRPQDLRPFLRTSPGVFTLPDPASARTLVREEIILEPQDSAALFVAGRPIELRGRFAEAATDTLGNLRVFRPTGVRTRYEVLASTDPRRSAPAPAALELPRIDSRIVELVRRTTAGLTGDRARVEALFGYLHRGFRYTLTPGDPGNEDPLARFLLETKSGHCEYFASALAVMLRLAGVPSVVVSGYAGGEWNPYGGYYLVRQQQAHSWVEAYVEGAWRTLDATPPSLDGASARFRIADLVDAFQMRWYRYVINYTLEDQAAGALSLRDSWRRFWGGLRRDWWTADDKPPAQRASRLPSIPWLVVGVVVSAALAGWAWRARGRTGQGDVATSAASKPYVRLLRALARLGLVKRAGETPREFARRAGPALGSAADRIAHVTDLYEEARFSGRDHATPRLDAEIDAVIAALPSPESATKARAP